MSFQLNKCYTIITFQRLKQSSSKINCYDPLQITLSENAWDFKFVKMWCSKFSLFYIIDVWLCYRCCPILYLLFLWAMTVIDWGVNTFHP